jgi:hypothetical protein
MSSAERDPTQLAAFEGFAIMPDVALALLRVGVMELAAAFEDLSDLASDLSEVVVPPCRFTEEEVALFDVFPEDEFPGVSGPPVELAAEGDLILQLLTLRLNEIVQKPQGRFVISYVCGRPGSKRPPRIQ